MIVKSDPNAGAITPANKPYMLLGAGKLTAPLWKTGTDTDRCNYEFTIARMERSNGCVSQLFSVRELRDLAKLVQVICFAVADDGCLPYHTRDELALLAERLRNVTE